MESLHILSALKRERRWRSFESHWPGWDVQVAELPEQIGERFYWSHKLIVINEQTDDVEWAVVHSAAHLQLDWPTVQLGRQFTDWQCTRADWLGEAWLRLWPGWDQAAPATIEPTTIRDLFVDERQQPVKRNEAA